MIGMNPYLIYALQSTPGLVRREFKRLSREAWDAPTAPDRFTPRQVVAHLLDWEPLLRDRIRAAVETPGATLRVWDENERAVEHQYDDWNPTESLDRWMEERKRTVEYVHSVPPEAWANTVVHPELGTMTAADLANMLPCHDVYHIEQLSNVPFG
ncbi:MAG: hypothetical protein C4341_04965 [Armatimonadota bacterium]